MTLFHKKFLTATVVGSMLVLAGCGGDASTDNKTETKPNGPTTHEIKTGEPNTDKKHINIGISAEPESLDPHKSSETISFEIQRQLFLTLLGTDELGKPIPSVATEWENKDFKIWTFKLRDDIKWSNGDPVTAKDFEYSLKRLTNPETGSPYGSYLVDAKVLNAKDIADGKAKPDTLGVKAIDDKTLEITLAEPVPFFADLLSFAVTAAVHQKTVETHGNKWLDPKNIVVNGAYIIKEAVVNGHITLTRNETYYDNANTKIDTATYLRAEGVNAVNRYKAGDLDINAGIPFDIFEATKKELGDEVKVTPAMCTYYYELNNTKPPFDNVKVRQAISMLLDRSIIPEKVLKRGEKPTYQFTPSSINGSPIVKPSWAADDMAKRVESAKALLAEAGYTAEKPLKFELLYTTSETAKRINAAISEEYKKITGGVVDFSINNQEWKVSLQTRREGKYAMASAGWCADYNEPSTFLNVFRSTNSNNTAFYKNPEFDKLLDQTLVSGVTDEQRKELYTKAEELLQADSPVVFMYESVAPMLMKPDVAGFPLNDPTHSYKLEDLYFVK